MNTLVQSVGEDKDGLWLKTSSSITYFDHVILTTSAQDALNIIGNSASEEESEILSPFQTNSNVVVLHSDTGVRNSCAS
jgi:predicted NAD/FAD-binding protein